MRGECSTKQEIVIKQTATLTHLFYKTQIVNQAPGTKLFIQQEYYGIHQKDHANSFLLYGITRNYLFKN